jgi:spore germination protein GerM
MIKRAILEYLVPSKPYGDVFRPSREPAKTIYDAFQKEAENRTSREFEDWTEAETQAVHKAACKYAEEHGLPIPTIEDVRDAEISASGHIDYAAKWAYRVAEKMRLKA